MAEQPRRGVLRSAGRGALTVLRQSSLRAKLGSLHLPLDLHPGRQRTILLPAATLEDEGAAKGDLPGQLSADGAANPPRNGATLPAAPERDALATAEGLRALRSQLGASERRVARLRQALARERQARQRPAPVLIAPERLIEQLVADLRQVGAGSPEAVRATITRVFAAHGIVLPYAVGTAAPGADGKRGEPGLPALPGWDPARLGTIVAALAAREPEIDGVRTLHLALASLACGDALSAAEAARHAGLTSAMARRRMRLALEGLCAAGVLGRQGERFAVRAPGDG